jgi:hypothetical protein
VRQQRLRNASVWAAQATQTVLLGLLNANQGLLDDELVSVELLVVLVLAPLGEVALPRLEPVTVSLLTLVVLLLVPVLVPVWSLVPPWF